MNFNTIREYSTNTKVIEKSRFICELFPVNNEQDAKDIIKSIRLEHQKACHHCYAYIIKQDYQNIENQSDDGEPDKTAGQPMLDILRYENLANVLAVVTRYFGGTLLGTGGLIKAYSSSVKDLVDLSDIKKLECMYGYLITCSYSLYQIINYELNKKKVLIEKIVFEEEVHLTVYTSDTKIIDYIMNKCHNCLVIEKLDYKFL